VLGGTLIVRGTLTVDAPLCVNGSLYAERLVVHAALTVDFADVSDRSAPPGSMNVRDTSRRE
jgi:hypothetical protein